MGRGVALIMDKIRKAEPKDLTRIAEIMVANFRLYFYPFFLNDGYYFGELQVPAVVRRCNHRSCLTRKVARICNCAAEFRN